MTEARREISSRKLSIFHKAAHTLVTLGVKPNQISIVSSVAALMAGLALSQAGPRTELQNALLLVIALVGVQLRLFCNVIDGLMAIEGGLKNPHGGTLQRCSRSLFLIFSLSLELAIRHHFLFPTVFSWVGSQRSLPYSQPTFAFWELLWELSIILSGPMAKQHRMFVINIALVGTVIEDYFSSWGKCLALALAIIALGSLVTCF